MVSGYYKLQVVGAVGQVLLRWIVSLMSPYFYPLGSSDWLHGKLSDIVIKYVLIIYALVEQRHLLTSFRVAISSSCIVDRCNNRLS